VKKEQKINILYFEASQSPGGSQKSLYNLLKGIDKTKYQAQVACMSGGPIMEKITDLGIDIIIFNHRYLQLITPRNFHKKIKIPSIIFPIINVIELVMNTVPVTLWLLYLIKIKKIQILHLNNLPSANFGGIVAAKIARLPSVCHLRGIDYVTKKERFISKFVNKYIAVSEAVKHHFQNHNFDPAAIEVVFNSVDLREYHSERNKTLLTKYDISNNIKVIASIGRIAERKGQIVFLKAAKKVIKEFPASKFLLIGGPDNSQESWDYFSQLKMFILKQNLTNHVIFTGFIKDIPKISSIIDIVVIPSTGTEALNRVISESMATGKAIIATDVGGNSEMIKNGYSGLLIPPSDPNSMAMSIINLLKNDELREQLGQKAIRFARENFSIDDHVRRIQRIYESLLPKKT